MRKHAAILVWASKTAEVREMQCHMLMQGMDDLFTTACTVASLSDSECVGRNVHLEISMD